MVKIAIGISTVQKRRQEALLLSRDILELSESNVPISIIVLSQGEDINIEEDIEDGIKLIRSCKRGLSLSRNTLINQLNAEYLWLIDDDIIISKQSLRRVVSLIEKTKKADVLIGKIECSDSQSLEYYKKYTTRNGLVGLLKTSSIEMIIKKDFIIDNDIRYNPLLGLGAKYPCGEENYFLVECWNKGAEINFFDETFIYHPCNEKKANLFGYFQTKEQVMSKVLLTKLLPFNFSVLYALKVIKTLMINRRNIKLALFFIRAVLTTKEIK